MKPLSSLQCAPGRLVTSSKFSLGFLPVAGLQGQYGTMFDISDNPLQAYTDRLTKPSDLPPPPDTQPSDIPTRYRFSPSSITASIKRPSKNNHQIHINEDRMLSEVVMYKVKIAVRTVVVFVNFCNLSMINICARYPNTFVVRFYLFPQLYDS